MNQYARVRDKCSVRGPNGMHYFLFSLKEACTRPP